MRGRKQVYPIFWVPCPGPAAPRVMPVCALRTADDGGIRSRGRLRSSGVVGYAQAGAGVPVSWMGAPGRWSSRRLACPQGSVQEFHAPVLCKGPPLYKGYV